MGNCDNDEHLSINPEALVKDNGPKMAGISQQGQEPKSSNDSTETSASVLRSVHGLSTPDKFQEPYRLALVFYSGAHSI